MPHMPDAELTRQEEVQMVRRWRTRGEAARWREHQGHFGVDGAAEAIHGYDFSSHAGLREACRCCAFQEGFHCGGFHGAIAQACARAAAADRVEGGAEEAEGQRAACCNRGPAASASTTQAGH
eukprot:6975417-Alexandrium_andersonii.AAC.1